MSSIITNAVNYLFPSDIFTVNVTDDCTIQQQSFVWNTVFLPHKICDSYRSADDDLQFPGD